MTTSDTEYLQMVQKERAKRVENALSTYDDPECSVSDLLADVMHHCETKGLDFQAALESATIFFTEELAEINSVNQ